ncbi:hypothetical protein Csp1_05730 [Corynebacterium provencense]|uniref:DUF6286 domain-containing protein n=1 Tax=Corynebacterium provencense TaxID=1737425 RepID=A0A2Z3YTL6_9CORY|nr:MULTISPECIES: DUF6286 domain-containing protein [Corynebacterium]AWT25387.1 hypothetical protein Csp1_05730 [Corynebacterium provencense]MCI1256227.1 DUF6286 domain-containing protein [Corynebacterium provencense]
MSRTEITDTGTRPSSTDRAVTDNRDTPPSADPAPRPAASPRARWLTMLLGLLLVAAGAAAVHDLLVVRGSLSDSQWLTPAYTWIADLHYAPWILPASVVSAVLALLLLVAAFRPRTRTHLSFAGDSALHARPVDIARLSTAAAERARGVLRASTVATRKKITVTVTSAARDTADRDAVTTAVTREVGNVASLLDPTPTVTVKITSPTTGGDKR